MCQQKQDYLYWKPVRGNKMLPNFDEWIDDLYRKGLCPEQIKQALINAYILGTREQITVHNNSETRH